MLIQFGPFLLGAFVGFAIFEAWWWRRRHDPIVAIGHVILFVWAMAFIGGAIFPIAVGETPPAAELPSNLQPLESIKRSLRAGDSVAQIGGNLLLFVPFGFAAPIVFRRLQHLVSLTVAAAAISTVVELLQLWVFTHRQGDIDDVILNTAGAVVGFLVWYVSRAFLSVSRDR